MFKRKITKHLIAAAFASLLCLTSTGQLNFDFTAGKMLIKGQVLDQQTGAPIPLANVMILNRDKGTACDEHGNFTLYVYKTDSLRFSSTGYISRIIHIYNIDSSDYYTLQVLLLHDFIKLKEVIIYPYRDMDDFKKAFIEGRGMKRVSIPGLAPPKYSNIPVKPKFANPLSLLYDRVKKRAADPEFKP